MTVNMGKHSMESKKKFRQRKREEKRQKKKQLKKASMKNHICLCNTSSCPDNTTVPSSISSSSSSSPSSSSSSSSSVKPKENQNLITFTSDPLYVRFMEYSMLKKRVAAIEQREGCWKSGFRVDAWFLMYFLVNYSKICFFKNAVCPPPQSIDMSPLFKI